MEDSFFQETLCRCTVKNAGSSQFEDDSLKLEIVASLLCRLRNSGSVRNRPL